jgi:hypothetical protein
MRDMRNELGQTEGKNLIKKFKERTFISYLNPHVVPDSRDRLKTKITDSRKEQEKTKRRKKKKKNLKENNFDLKVQTTDRFVVNLQF